MPPKTKKKTAKRPQLPKAPPAAAKKPVAKKLEYEHGWMKLKELQSVIAFRCYESLDAKGMQKPEQEEKVYELYHGTASEDAIGMAKKFFMGTEMFEGIYDEVTDEVSGESYKVLKRIFHCSENVYKCSEDIPEAINMKNLTANTSTDRTLLTGRAILSAAKKIEAVGRKVLAHVMKSSKYSDPNFKVSGEGWEDYLKFCRYMMIKEEENTIDLVESEDAEDEGGEVADNKQTTSAEEGKGKEEAAEEEDKKPAAVMTEDELQEAVKAWSGYGTFKGYMAWALWGHIPKPGLEDFKATKFMVTDASASISGGRKATRKRKAEEEDTKRSNQPGRGLSAADAIQIEDIEIRKEGNSNFKKSLIVDHSEMEFQTLHAELEFCNTEIYQWSSMVTSKSEIFENGCANHEKYYREYYPYQQWYDARQRRMEVMDRIKQLGQEAAKEKEAAKEEERQMKKAKVEEEGTTIPSQIAVGSSTHSADDQLPKATGNIE